MENNPRFVFFNFVPRLNLTNDLIQILETLQARVPLDASCNATIRRQQDLFHFEIIFHSARETFRAKTTIDVRERRCRERMWQVNVVRDMVQEIGDQIRHWHSRRFAA